MAVTKEEAVKIYEELAKIAKTHNLVIWWRQQHTEDVKFVSCEK
jgi:hypothetical protein